MNDDSCRVDHPPELPDLQELGARVGTLGEVQRNLCAVENRRARLVHHLPSRALGEGMR